MPDSDEKAMEQNLDLPTTRRDLTALEQRLETRFEQIDVRFGQIDGRFDEVKRHFDVVAEEFRTQFNNLFDWTQATTSTLGTRLDALETARDATSAVDQKSRTEPPARKPRRNKGRVGG